MAEITYATGRCDVFPLSPPLTGFSFILSSSAELVERAVPPAMMPPPCSNQLVAIVWQPVGCVNCGRAHGRPTREEKHRGCRLQRLASVRTAPSRTVSSTSDGGPPPCSARVPQRGWSPCNGVTEEPAHDLAVPGEVCGPSRCLSVDPVNVRGQRTSRR